MNGPVKSREKCTGSSRSSPALPRMRSGRAMIPVEVPGGNGSLMGTSVYRGKCKINLTNMKSIYFIAGCICLLAFAVMPAQAFTAKALTINLDTNGNAQVDFQYDLSFTEQIAVFANIASPANELKTGLENNLNREVTVVKADSSSAEVIIPSFASVSQSNGTETITTPAFSFANAENAIRQYLVGPVRLGRPVSRCDDHHVPGRVRGKVSQPDQLHFRIPPDCMSRVFAFLSLLTTGTGAKPGRKIIFLCIHRELCILKKSPGFFVPDRTSAVPAPCPRAKPARVSPVSARSSAGEPGAQRICSPVCAPIPPKTD